MQTKTMTPNPRRVLGKGLADIMRQAQQPNSDLAGHWQITVRRTRLPRPRALTYRQVRECGTRSGITAIFPHWWTGKRLIHTLSIGAASSFLARLAGK